MKISPESLLNLLSPLKAADSAREQRASAAAEARLRDSKAAVETLKGRTSQASEERKAEARQKIEQLKARLQMLRSMASMDPEGTARLAAQLARELGAAVKAYAAAGGTGGGGGATGVAVPAPSGADAATTETGEAAVATAEPPLTDPTADKASGKTEDAGKSANPYQSVLDEQQAQAADLSRRSGEQRADREFMADVRKMAAELKALVRAATEKARAGDDDALSPQEAQDLDRSVAEMDRQIGQATGDMGGGLVSLLV